MLTSALRLIGCVASLSLLALMSQAHAQSGEIPSCYSANQLPLPAHSVKRELFVVIDQTTVLDAALTQSLGRQLQPLVVPGTRFRIFSFSAFSQGRYLQPLGGGTLEPPLVDASVRNATAVGKLKALDACLKSQWAYGTKLAAKAVGEALAGSTDTLAKSDVLSSLAAVSNAIRDEATGARKTVLVVSDMLENSSITSFYAKDRMRQINPVEEARKVEKANVQADFAGADVYVMGAGIVPELPRGGKGTLNYRTPQALEALHTFWEGFFDRSHARLVAFGMPALLTQIK
ncbi:hypothetical protein PSO31014_00703 [Pandoraea soli]|uniref:VWFA domain-containing protein n=1 Tax=Pandoraea soli TaxID=2508293 RepID=A0ABY6VQZ9_9BURK|nr:hypothetical protein PSO31014_00703 [Pandoraea soli]